MAPTWAGAGLFILRCLATTKNSIHKYPRIALNGSFRLNVSDFFLHFADLMTYLLARN